MQSKKIGLSASRNGNFVTVDANDESWEGRSDARRRRPATERANGQLSIVLIDRRPLTRQCLVRWLEQDRPDFRITPVETVTDARIARDVHLIIFSTGADDIRSRRILEDIHHLTRHSIQIPIVILSECDELDAVAEAIRHGARGYIPTSLDLAEAAEAIRFVQAGGTYVPADIVVRTMERRADPRDGDRTPFETLTPREKEVLGHLRQGKPNKIIADDLKISEATVKVFVRRILRKLHAMNRTEVAYLAQQQL
jgi:DNA-binding NarL/FixJ family response regulator